VTHITPQQLAAMIASNPDVQIANPSIQESRQKPSPQSELLEQSWTGTERRFAAEYLQPLVDNGTYLYFMPQISLYMPGQLYTFDFVALRPEGGADHFEVKGAFSLGSESRSSVKVRWATAFICSPERPHRVFWAKEKNGQWKIREVKAERGHHPIAEPTE